MKHNRRQCKTLADLEQLAEKNGYKKGWARHIFKSWERKGLIVDGEKVR